MKLKFTSVMYTKSILWGICKMILAIPFRSVMLFLSAFYSIGIGVAKRNTFKINGEDYNKYNFSGIIIIISSIIYILYSIYGFLYGMRTNYHMYVAIGIAAVSFTDITIAIIGVIKSRKSENMQNKIMKLLNLATAFTSISLTQTALLSFTMTSDNSKANGAMGIIMGLASIIVGTYIVIYVSNFQKE